MASSNLNTIKILIIGPLQCGKTAVANLISERSQNESLSNNYRPTVGIRILEFEKEAPRNPKRPGQEKVMIELWDVSGDPKYDRCWPAIQKGTHGIILMYNADNPKHETELEGWVASFPKKMGIQASLCIGFAHHLGGKEIKGKTKPPKGLDKLTFYDTSVEQGTTTILPAFDKFFSSLMMSIYERQEREEKDLMDNK